jgi:integration host factor subunit alpha
VPNVTKQDLVQQASLTNGRTQTETRAVFESFLQLVGEQLQGGNSIEIRGFGTFHARKRLPRPARNPRTGEVVPLGERTVALFKFSSDLRLDAPSPTWETQQAVA